MNEGNMDRHEPSQEDRDSSEVSDSAEHLNQSGEWIAFNESKNLEDANEFDASRQVEKMVASGDDPTALINETFDNIRQLKDPAKRLSAASQFVYGLREAGIDRTDVFDEIVAETKPLDDLKLLARALSETSWGADSFREEQVLSTFANIACGYVEAGKLDEARDIIRRMGGATVIAIGHPDVPESSMLGVIYPVFTVRPLCYLAYHLAKNGEDPTEVIREARAHIEQNKYNMSFGLDLEDNKTTLDWIERHWFETKRGGQFDWPEETVYRGV